MSSTNVPLIANDKRFANLVTRLLIFLGGSLLGQAWFPMLGLCDGTALGAACLFGGVLTMSSLLIRPGQSNWPDRLGEAFFTCLLWYIPVGLGISAASAVFVLGLQTNPQVSRASWCYHLGCTSRFSPSRLYVVWEYFERGPSSEPLRTPHF